MSDKKKRAEMDRATEMEGARLVEDAMRAISLRRTGHSWGTIAQQLGRSVVQVEELAKAGYDHFLGQMDADTLRAEMEDRIDSVIRQANIELASATTVGERNALYRTILAADARRAKLFGLDMKAAGDGA